MQHIVKMDGKVSQAGHLHKKHLAKHWRTMNCLCKLEETLYVLVTYFKKADYPTYKAGLFKAGLR